MKQASTKDNYCRAPFLTLLVSERQSPEKNLDKSSQFLHQKINLVNIESPKKKRVKKRLQKEADKKAEKANQSHYTSSQIINSSSNQ